MFNHSSSNKTNIITISDENIGSLVFVSILGLFFISICCLEMYLKFNNYR